MPRTIRDPRPGEHIPAPTGRPQRGGQPATTAVPTQAAPASSRAATPEQAAKAYGIAAGVRAAQQRRADAVKAGRSKFGPVAEPNSENFDPGAYGRLVLNELGKAVAADDPRYSALLTHGNTNNLLNQLANQGVYVAPGFRKTNAAGNENWRGIHSVNSQSGMEALQAAIAAEPSVLGKMSPEEAISFVAKQSNIPEDQVLDRIESAGKFAQFSHRNALELAAETIARARPIIAGGGDDAAAILASMNIVDPVEQQRIVEVLRTGGAPGNSSQPNPPNAGTMKQEAAGAVPADNAGKAAAEEAFHKRAGRWLNAGSLGGVPNWAYAGSLGAGGVSLAAYLLAAGGQQADPGAYQDQQALAHSYGSY